MFHPFEVVVEANIDARAARHWLEAQCARLCGDFGEEALRFSRVIDQKLGVDVPGPDASVRIRTTDQARIAFEITLFCRPAAPMNSRPSSPAACWPRSAPGASTARPQDGRLSLETSFGRALGV